MAGIKPVYEFGMPYFQPYEDIKWERSQFPNSKTGEDIIIKLGHL